jgi:putative ATP-dependent endonuclease of OLD family
MGEDEALHWSDESIHFDNMTMWSTNITLVSECDLGERWKEFQDQSAAHYGNVKSLKKNPLAVAKALELAWDQGIKSQALIGLIENILKSEANKSMLSDSLTLAAN